LLVALLAFVAAQDQICASADSTTDLSARLFADVTTVNREAVLRPLPIEYNAAVVVNKDQYDIAVSARFSFRGEWTADQTAAVNTAINARMDAVVAAFPTDTAGRINLFVCINGKATAIVATLDAIRAAVADFLTAYFNAFTEFQARVNTYFENFKVTVEGNDAVAIATVRIQVAAARALQTTKDIQFYVAEKEQATNAAISDAVTKVKDWLNAISIGSTAAAIAAARETARAQLVVVVQLQVDLRRAKALETQVKAEIEAIRIELEAAKARLANAITIAWTDARAKFIAHFEVTAAQIAENQRRLAEALSNIRCDTVNATFTATLEGDQATGSVRVAFRGIRCYDARDQTYVSGFFCAALRAWVLTEASAARADTYTCVAVAKKRSLEQGGGSDMSADVVATNPGTAPIPTTSPVPVSQQSASTSIVACFLLLLIWFIFHF